MMYDVSKYSSREAASIKTDHEEIKLSKFNLFISKPSFHLGKMNVFVVLSQLKQAAILI